MVQHRQIEAGQVAHQHLIEMPLGQSFSQETVDQGVGPGVAAHDAGLEDEDLAHECAPVGEFVGMRIAYHSIFLTNGDSISLDWFPYGYKAMRDSLNGVDV